MKCYLFRFTGIPQFEQEVDSPQGAVQTAQLQTEFQQKLKGNLSVSYGDRKRFFPANEKQRMKTWK